MGDQQRAVQLVAGAEAKEHQKEIRERGAELSWRLSPVSRDRQMPGFEGAAR